MNLNKYITKEPEITLNIEELENKAIALGDELDKLNSNLEKANEFNEELIGYVEQVETNLENCDTIKEYVTNLEMDKLDKILVSSSLGSIQQSSKSQSDNLCSESANLESLSTPIQKDIFESKETLVEFIENMESINKDNNEVLLNVITANTESLKSIKESILKILPDFIKTNKAILKTRIIELKELKPDATISDTTLADELKNKYGSILQYTGYELKDFLSDVDDIADYYYEIKNGDLKKYSDDKVLSPKWYKDDSRIRKSVNDSINSNLNNKLVNTKIAKDNILGYKLDKDSDKITIYSNVLYTSDNKHESYPEKWNNLDKNIIVSDTLIRDDKYIYTRAILTNYVNTNKETRKELKITAKQAIEVCELKIKQLDSVNKALVTPNVLKLIRDSFVKSARAVMHAFEDLVPAEDLASMLDYALKQSQSKVFLPHVFITRFVSGLITGRSSLLKWIEGQPNLSLFCGYHQNRYTTDMVKEYSKAIIKSNKDKDK